MLRNHHPEPTVLPRLQLNEPILQVRPIRISAILYLTLTSFRLPKSYRRRLGAADCPVILPDAETTNLQSHWPLQSEEA